MSLLKTYPNIDSTDFNQKIFEKEEFYDLRLKEGEIELKDYFDYQKVVERFLSPHTLYDRLLLRWDPGVGKTAAFTAVAENLKKYGVNKVLVIVPGRSLKDELPMQISDVILKGLVPDVAKRYHFETIRYFLKLSKFPERMQFALKEWENSLIVIDEAHNLRLKKSAEEQDEDEEEISEAEFKETYNGAWNFLHQVKHARVMLLTGTPMKDRANEIATLLNLILPATKQKQLPTGSAFDKEFIDPDTKKIKPEKIEDLKSRMLGLVSFLRKKEEGNAKAVFQGSIVDEKMSIPVVALQMQGIQNDEYSKVKDNKLNVYKAPIKLSQGGVQKVDLKNLKETSIVYGKILEEIKAHPNEKHFVFAEDIAREGLDRLVNILNAHNISNRLVKAGSSGSNKEKIAAFNDPENWNGSKIQVLMGGKKLKEGITLKDVMHVHFAGAVWNYSTLEQIIARAVRTKSHDVYTVKTGIMTPEVKVYLYTPFCCNKLTVQNSVFYRQYITCLEKDKGIKSIERIMKEISFTCGLFYKQNLIPEDIPDGDRKCEYERCTYSCDGLSLAPSELRSDNPLKASQRDYSTFNAYYISLQRKKVIEKIKLLFRLESKMYLEDIRRNIPSRDKTQALDALNFMIYNNTEILSRFNLPSYLRNEGELYFLVDNRRLDNSDHSLGFYVDNPVVFDDNSFENILTEERILYVLENDRDNARDILSKKEMDLVSKIAGQNVFGEEEEELLPLEGETLPENWQYWGLIDANFKPGEGNHFLIKARREGAHDGRTRARGQACNTLQKKLKEVFDFLGPEFLKFLVEKTENEDLAELESDSEKFYTLWTKRYTAIERCNLVRDFFGLKKMLHQNVIISKKEAVEEAIKAQINVAEEQPDFLAGEDVDIDALWKKAKPYLKTIGKGVEDKRTLLWLDTLDQLDIVQLLVRKNPSFRETATIVKN